MLDQLARQNRWWADPAAIAADRHLVRRDRSSVRWRPASPFTFDRDVLYTLRGPRQVGKTTLLKQEIARLLGEGRSPGRVLYLDVELAGLERPADLVAALRAYVDRARAGTGASSGRLALFLDEVTRVENWAGALRGLIDNDELGEATIVATGSHTRDLLRGGERLPGRRGGGPELDLEMLPLGFREYVALLDPAALPEPTRRLEVTDPQRLVALRPRLSALFQRYLATGGLLTALDDEAEHGAVTAETFQTYREAIVGEFMRAGLRESYLREVVNFLARHVGQEFSDGGIAADTDIGAKDTARNYVDTLVSSYVAAVFHRTSRLDEMAPAFRAPRKIHPLDPLLWHLVRAWASNDPDPWPAVLAACERPDDVGHLVESVVAVHLRRAFGNRVAYWRKDERHEIDFVVWPAEAAAELLEVKYRSRVQDRDAEQLVRMGGGLVLTAGHAGTLAGGAVRALPVAELLAMLETPAVGPARL